MIKLLVMDVDGTLTDGKIYIGTQGEIIKVFDVKDGYGIKVLLPQNDIIPVIITARNSTILQLRCNELGIEELHQGVQDKMKCLTCVMDRLGVFMNEVAYIGDDMLDLQCMIQIRQHGGLAACPANAIPQITANCDFVSSYPAGMGAVREFIEYIISRRDDSVVADSLMHRLKKAVKFIENLTDVELGKFQVSPDFYYNVVEYIPGECKSVPYESHRKYVDIQRVVEGEELLMISDVSSLTSDSSYDEDGDFLNYYGNDTLSGVILRKGSTVILFPKDGHKSVRYGESNNAVRKIVGKLLINP